MYQKIVIFNENVCGFFWISEFIKSAILNPPAGRLWPAGRIFDTPDTLHPPIYLAFLATCYSLKVPSLGLFTLILEPRLGPGASHVPLVRLFNYAHVGDKMAAVIPNRLHLRWCVFAFFCFVFAARGHELPVGAIKLATPSVQLRAWSWTATQVGIDSSFAAVLDNCCLFLGFFLVFFLSLRSNRPRPLKPSN